MATIVLGAKFMLLRSMKLFARALGGPAFAVALSLLAPPGYAQRAADSPFAGLSGSWSGSGSIAMSSGVKERIRCRAVYRVDHDSVYLRLELRCASDSYKFELQSSVTHSNGTISGIWNELTRGAAGDVSGIAIGHQIQLRAIGPTFAAIMVMNTRADRQSISIQAPGSEMSEVTISLNRGSR